MNILFFTESGLGVGALVVDQISELKRQNANTYGVVSSLEQEEGLIRRMEREGIELLRLEGLESHQNFWTHLDKLIKFSKTHAIEVIHVQTNWELMLSFAAKLALRFQSNPKIVYTVHAFRHNSPYKKYIALCIINVLLFLFANRVICTCEYTKKLFRLVGYKTKLLPLGIDERFFSEEHTFAECAGLSLMFPAQFRFGKQQDMIIKAFAWYVQKCQDRVSQLILPGEGPLRKEMEKLAKELGLEGRVLFPGHCKKDEVKRLFGKVNIAVISSNSETFGQCIVEPYVMGKAILSTPVGIAPELIKDGVNGYIFHNAEELCNILCRLSKDESLVKKMGVTNFDDSSRFAWQTITKDYLQDLEQMLF